MSRSESSTTLSTLSFSIKWNLLYRGSEHEFSTAAFHQLCDNKGPTFVLIKAKNGRVAAGYSCVSWIKGDGGVESNPRGFLCAIDENDLSLQVFKGVPGECKIQHHSKYGPLFSNGLCVFDKCDKYLSSKYLSSHSMLGKGFECYGDQFALFRTHTFTVVEYEVFGIDFF
jgi:hypothetical protein